MGTLVLLERHPDCGVRYPTEVSLVSIMHHQIQIRSLRVVPIM